MILEFLVGEGGGKLLDFFWKILDLVPIPDDTHVGFQGHCTHFFLGEGEDARETCVIS